MDQVLLKIFGTVQGVNFRYETKCEADRLGISGWVKNENDGSVLVCAQAEEAKLQRFIDWCSHGPDSAQVTRIEKTFQKPSTDLTEFKIL